ncbi:TcaA NTF2-like domain-containing protein [Neobacillus drentensis]|uniref:TcaA NTF2-like domain-containing protein n=1 Tax=Neobacillus drentensis TaxID=220684 RepID=UPI003B589B0C
MVKVTPLPSIPIYLTNPSLTITSHGQSGKGWGIPPAHPLKKIHFTQLTSHAEKFPPPSFNLLKKVKNPYQLSTFGYHITTAEEYTIYYGDGTSKPKMYESEYQLKFVGSELKVDHLIKTTEIDTD